MATKSVKQGASRAKGKSSTATTAPGAKFTEALALMHDLDDAAGTLASDLKYGGEETFPSVCVILAGLTQVLRWGAEADNPDDLERYAEQTMTALAMIEEALPPADPLFKDVEQISDRMRELVSGYLPADHVDGASEEDDPDAWRREVVNALEEVRLLAQDAVKVAEDGSNCWRLLMIAEYKHLQFLPDFDDEGTLIDECMDLEALFRGAAAVSDAPLGARLLCEKAAGLMDRATGVIDRASIAAAHARAGDRAAKLRAAQAKGADHV